MSDLQMRLWWERDDAKGWCVAGDRTEMPAGVHDLLRRQIEHDTTRVIDGRAIERVDFASALVNIAFRIVRAWRIYAPGDELRVHCLLGHDDALTVSSAINHDGNHKYARTLQRRLRRHLPQSLPYPKFDLNQRGAA
jgi:hypothetical protein